MTNHRASPLKIFHPFCLAHENKEKSSRLKEGFTTWCALLCDYRTQITPKLKEKLEKIWVVIFLFFLYTRNMTNTMNGILIKFSGNSVGLPIREFLLLNSDKLNPFEKQVLESRTITQKSEKTERYKIWQIQNTIQSLSH